MRTSGFLLLLLISAASFALKKELAGKLHIPHFQEAKACDGRPDFLTEVRSDFIGTLNQLPEAVLVARAVEYYVEFERGLRVHGYQSLQSPNSKSRILCGSGGELNQRFSLLAPTLIDTHKKRNDGHSLWQFQLLTDVDRFSFWNLRSVGLKRLSDLEDWIKSNGARYKVYQRTHTEFELMIVKQSAQGTQYLSVRYDAVL